MLIYSITVEWTRRHKGSRLKVQRYKGNQEVYIFLFHINPIGVHVRFNFVLLAVFSEFFINLYEN